MANILVVDDDKVITKIACAILQKAGHSVLVAHDGHSAIEILGQELFDLVISDANMPGGMSGFNLVATIRKNPSLKHIPIIFLTGRKEKQDVQRALQSGVDDYIVKPIDQDIFLAKIDSLLQAKAAHQFIITPVKETGKWEVELKIVGISEQGLSLISPFQIPINTKLKLESHFFQTFWLKSPRLRVASCTTGQESEQSFKIMANFIGLTESDHQNIRRWALANQVKKSEKGPE